jgi:peptidoglycan LD-endopeptidase LytH
MSHAALVGTAGALLLLAGARPSVAPQAVAAAAAAPSVATELVSPGERWFEATRAALDDALDVELPFAELTAADGRPLAFSFHALAGQPLEVSVARAAEALPEAEGRDDGAIYVEVFRVVDVLGQGLHERLTALRPGAASLRTRLPSDGTYHVLVQPERAGVGARRFTLELGAVLPFPVVGARADSIRGLFGATRDAGHRDHQGVDIFVQRLTPVLAVTSGRAKPGQDALGGNTVWLNTPGTSYYYAHLDRVAVRDDQPVKAGDVLGYVGNTGNARNVASHLHFGVYRWGKEPIDPLPLLIGQRFAKGSATTQAADAGG